MSDSAVGFSMSENLLRVVQLSPDNDSFRIKKIEQKKFPHPFRLLTLDNQDRFQALLSVIEESFKQNEWASTVGVSIPNDLVLIKEFPVDEDLSREELDRHVHWEATQFLPDELPGEYLLSYQRLNFDEPSVVMLAFRELVLHRIQQAFELAGRTPQFLGPDIFSGLTAVSRLYEPNEGLTATLEVGENKAHLALLKGGDYLLSKKLPYTLSEENETALEENSSALAAFLKKEMRRLLLDRKIDEGEMPISQLFVYGDKAYADLITGLEGGPAVEVTLVNPFENTAADGLNSEAFRENPSVWAPAVGVAIEALEA